MFFGFLPKRLRSLGFKLTVGYSIIFVASAVLIFGFAHFFLFATLKAQQRNEILEDAKEFTDVYESKGFRPLLEKLKEEELEEGGEVFLGLSKADFSPLFMSADSRWDRYDLQPLSRLTGERDGTWSRLPSVKGELPLELYSSRLSDGTWLHVGTVPERREEILRRFRATFSAVLLPVTLFGFLAGSLLAFRALRPVRRLIRTVEAVDITRIDTRVPSPRTGDELDELVNLFNRMLERIASLVAAMKGSLDNVGHDLRTPLARLHTVAEAALQSKDSIELYKQALGECIEESEHILRLLNTLMDISKAEAGVISLNPSRISVASLVERVADLYQPLAEEKSIQLHVRIPADLTVVVDTTRMSQALANLVDNAVKFTPPGGEVFLEANKEEGQVVISVRDTGLGIPASELPRIWDRLYRGRENGGAEGLGLGLTMVRSMVSAHGGTVSVSTQPGRGSTFRIHLGGDVPK